MSATHRRAATAEPTATAVPTFGRLLGTELHRLWARRFFRVCLVLGVLGYLATLVLFGVTHKRVDAADRAQATVQRDRQLVLVRQQIQQCKSQAPTATDASQCGDPPSEADFPIDNFFHNHPVRPDALAALALTVGAGVALLGFTVGATFIGAEWSSKNLVAWLFWEPRRLRLLGAKLLALLAVSLALSVLAQLVFAIAARVLLHYRGLPISSAQPPDPHFWAQFGWVQVRAGLLVLVIAPLGFGLASLIRNTAAAFGVSFVYFAVLETLARAHSPNLSQYLYTTSLSAWVTRHGITVYLGEKYDPVTNGYASRSQHVSNLHGGVMLVVYGAVVTVLAGWFFRRRNIA